MEEQCCHLTDLVQCKNPAVYWIGTGGGDYTLACETHKKELVGPDDVVRELNPFLDVKERMSSDH